MSTSPSDHLALTATVRSLPLIVAPVLSSVYFSNGLCPCWSTAGASPSSDPMLLNAALHPAGACLSSSESKNRKSQLDVIIRSPCLRCP